MTNYAVLLRGVNVGGKNTLPMADFANALRSLGYGNVRTYIASGNAVLSSEKSAHELQHEIQTMLSTDFVFDSSAIKVLVLSQQQLQAAIDNKPTGFGEQPGVYHSDAIFLINTTVAAALPVFRPRAGVDEIWPGAGVIYSQRLSAERTKSRLSAIVGTPVYASMTIRTWNTVCKLVELLQAIKTAHTAEDNV